MLNRNLTKLLLLLRFAIISLSNILIYLNNKILYNKIYVYRLYYKNKFIYKFNHKFLYKNISIFEKYKEIIFKINIF